MSTPFDRDQMMKQVILNKERMRDRQASVITIANVRQADNKISFQPEQQIEEEKELSNLPDFQTPKQENTDSLLDHTLSQDNSATPNSTRKQNSFQLKEKKMSRNQADLPALPQQATVQGGLDLRINFTPEGLVPLFNQKYPLLQEERVKQQARRMLNDVSGNEGDIEPANKKKKISSKQTGMNSPNLLQLRVQNSSHKAGKQLRNLHNNMGGSFQFRKENSQWANFAKEEDSSPLNKQKTQTVQTFNQIYQLNVPEQSQNISENLTESFHKLRVRQSVIYSASNNQSVNRDPLDESNEIPLVSRPVSSQQMQESLPSGILDKLGTGIKSLKARISKKSPKSDDIQKLKLQSPHKIEEDSKKLDRLLNAKSKIATALKKKLEMTRLQSQKSKEAMESSSETSQGEKTAKVLKKRKFVKPSISNRLYDKILKKHEDKINKSLNLKLKPGDTGILSNLQSDRDFMSLVKPKQYNIIQQNHPLKVAWDIFIIFVAVYFAFVIPMQIAFEGEFFSHEVFDFANLVFGFLFFLDILISFRTSFFNQNTGEEVLAPKQIAVNYLSSFRFQVDLISAIPFDLILLWFIDAETAHRFKITSLIKLLRVFRISAMITYMNTTEDVKLLLELCKLLFFLLLYIHCTACLIYLVADSDGSWIPTTYDYYMYQDSYFDAPFRMRYLIAFYNAVLALTGNEINPKNELHIFTTSFLLIFGSLIIANLFGTIAVIVSSMNRKAQRFQEQIDVANTSMKNMKLPEDLQGNVRRFMMSTQSNLDNQKELDQFMRMISPSLRNQVTKHIFLDGISKNSILNGVRDMVDFLINDVNTLLYLPEDVIVSQGQAGESLYLIATGDCIVWVKDHRKCQIFVQQIWQGEYFGEISLITQCPRSATVKSSNYCTLISMNKLVFYNLCASYPDILLKMKLKTMNYKDPWKQMKLELLRQVDYFQFLEEDEEFLDEIHYNLKEENFETGVDIISAGEQCTSIIFIVEGIIDLIVFDPQGEEYVLETLQQGDNIGQYSVIFNEGFIFTAVAKSSVRILTLSSEFFMKKVDQIEGLEDAVLEAEDFVEKYGLPICDFKIYEEGSSSLEKFKRCVFRAIQLNKLKSQPQKPQIPLKKKRNILKQTLATKQEKRESIESWISNNHKIKIKSSKDVAVKTPRRKSILAKKKASSKAIESLLWPPTAISQFGQSSLSKLKRKLTHQASGGFRRKVNESKREANPILMIKKHARRGIQSSKNLESFKYQAQSPVQMSQFGQDSKQGDFNTSKIKNSPMKTKWQEDSQHQRSNEVQSLVSGSQYQENSQFGKNLTDLSEDSQEEEEKSSPIKDEVVIPVQKSQIQSRIPDVCLPIIQENNNRSPVQLQIPRPMRTGAIDELLVPTRTVTGQSILSTKKEMQQNKQFIAIQKRVTQNVHQSIFAKKKTLRPSQPQQPAPKQVGNDYLSDSMSSESAEDSSSLSSSSLKGEAADIIPPVPVQILPAQEMFMRMNSKRGKDQRRKSRMYALNMAKQFYQK